MQRRHHACQCAVRKAMHQTHDTAVRGTTSKPCVERLWAFKMMSKYILSYSLTALRTKCPHRVGPVGSGTFWQFSAGDVHPHISRWISAVRVFSGKLSSVQMRAKLCHFIPVIRPDSQFRCCRQTISTKFSNVPRMFGIQACLYASMKSNSFCCQMHWLKK